MIKNMNSSFYKYCIVPHCKNTSVKTPNKLFVHVPNKKEMRIKWLTLARRVDAHTLSTQTRMYFCEDHFDLPNDMLNYTQYRIMGSVAQVRMKPGCVPNRFGCQEDKRKWTCGNKERAYRSKKQRMMAVADCVKESQDSLTLKDSSHICSADGSTSWQCADNGTSVPGELSGNQLPMAGQRDPNRFTPHQYATMIYYYGVSRGDALKAATLYRKHISKQPQTPGQVKRLPAYTFFLDLHKSLPDGVIPDLPEPDPKFFDTKREDENQSVVLTQLFNLGLKWTPREVATMLYYYGVTGGHALRTANMYRKHVESLPDTGASKRMPGYGFFLDLYKSLSEGVLSASREQVCSERKDDLKPRRTARTLISRANVNHHRSLDSSSAATSSESDLEVEESEVASQPEPEQYACQACNTTFTGFVYECVQCDYRMCSDCDHAGVHKEHYVLRVPAHSPREEVKEVVSKVRVALNLVELRPPPHAQRKAGRKPRVRRVSDDGPPEVPVLVKMEVDIEEDDPLTFPQSPSPSPTPSPSRVKREPDAAVPDDAHVYAMLDATPETQEDILQVTIKSEPPDEEPSTSQLPPTDPRHAPQQLDRQRSQPEPQQSTDAPGKRVADSAAEGNKPKKGRLKKKVDT